MDVALYLDRIGARAPAEPTLDALAALALAHLCAVPFENLDIAAGRPLSLDPEAIYEKIVARRRGGFCYELNGLFGCLLRELGYDVTFLAARIPEPPDGTPRPDRAHLVLLVRLDGLWLVDVGWGEIYRQPFALRAGNEHADLLIGEYRLEAVDGAWQVLERHEDSLRTDSADWRVAYRFDLEPRELADFADACRWHEHESPLFTRRRFCTLATPDGRRTLIDRRLIVRSRGARTEREVEDAEVPELLAELFGIVV